MKRCLVAAIALAFIIGTIYGFLVYYQTCYYVGPAKVYTSLEQAVKEGEVSRAWLPEFLPGSAHDIKEKYNYERNVVIAAFSFDPFDDLSPMLTEAKELPKIRYRTVPGFSLCGKQSWFPRAISEGHFDELTAKGFRIYEIGDEPPKVGDHKLLHWFLAINQSTGTGYLWNY